MEIDSNSCTVSEKWARDHMQERSPNCPPDCLCLCSSVGEMSVYTLWICLHSLTIGTGMNWCLYDCMSCMYIQCAGLRKKIEISLNRSGELNIAGHHSPHALLLSSRVPIWVSNAVALCSWCSDTDVSIFWGTAELSPHRRASKYVKP